MKKIHYGWFVCAGCFLMIFVTIGLCTSVHSVFQPYLIEQAHLTQAQGSMVTTIRCLFSFLAIFFVRKFHDKLGVRLGAALAVLFLAVAYIGFSFTRTYSMLLLSATFLGFANGLGGTVPMSILMNRWFVSRKGLAMGICSSGSGCAGILMPLLLTNIIEKKGVQYAFLFEACLVCTLALCVFLLVRDTPEQKNLAPYLEEKAAGVTKARQHRSEQASTAVVILIYLAATLMGAISTPAFGHMTVLFAEAGMNKVYVAAGVSVMGIALLIGKFSFGFFVDSFGGKLATLVFGTLCLLGYGTCCFSGSASLAILYSSYFLVGLGVSLATLGIPIWTSELFSGDAFEKNVHRLTLCYVGGEIIFNELPGIIADTLGSYVPAFIMFAVISAAVVCLVEAAYTSSSRSARV